MADDNKPLEPSAPPTGANPAATPNTRQVPGGDAPATAAAAAALKDESLKPLVTALSQNDRSMKVRDAALDALKVMG